MDDDDSDLDDLKDFHGHDLPGDVNHVIVLIFSLSRIILNYSVDVPFGHLDVELHEIILIKDFGAVQNSYHFDEV